MGGLEGGWIWFVSTFPLNSAVSSLEWSKIYIEFIENRGSRLIWLKDYMCAQETLGTIN